jgi:hypothetical protein
MLSACFVHHHSFISQVKVYEHLGFMRHKGAKVSPNDDMPMWLPFSI